MDGQPTKAHTAVLGHWLEVAMDACSCTRAGASLARCCGHPTCEEVMTPTTSTLVLRCALLGDSAGACTPQYSAGVPDGAVRYAAVLVGRT